MTETKCPILPRCFVPHQQKVPYNVWYFIIFIDAIIRGESPIRTACMSPFPIGDSPCRLYGIQVGMPKS